jgi:hypothetical protein
MTSQPIDSDTATIETNPRTMGADRMGGRAPFRIHLGPDRHVELDYRQTAIAAGALGLGVLAFKGVSALLAKGAKQGAIAPGHDGQVPPVPMASTLTPMVPSVPTGTGAEFVGEPAVDAPSDATATPFVATSDNDDTGGLLVEVTEIDIVSVTPVGISPGAPVGAGADRSALTPEHVPTDLMGDTPPDPHDRAIDAFRPDPTAPVPPEMRDSLRPATGPATGFAGNRGDFAQGLSQADGSK